MDYKHENEHYEVGEEGVPPKYNQGEDLDYVVDPVAERALVRKIDRHLLPMLWIMYIFNYIDRTNIGNAKVGGMEADLKLSSSDYSLILSIFFVSYLLFEVPSNMILVRSKPAIFLPAIMFIWGAVSIAVKGINNLGGMVAFRIALGIIEAGFFPGVMLLMSCWYKPAELSKRIAMFYTASLMSGAFGGLLAGAIIEGMNGVAGVRGWKWLFIIEGAGTCVAACFAFFILPNYPTTTKWLSEDEKALAVNRLAQREESDNHVSHKKAFMDALKDPKTWTFMLAYNLLNSVGTISYFFPTLMNALGYKGRSAQFMTVPIYCVALVVALATGVSADKTGQKAYHVIGACGLGVLSFIICVTVQNPAVKYTFICFGGAGVWSAVPLFLSWMVTMFDGREKRAICIALINGVGNLASIYGSFFWPKTDAPKYIMGFAITTALMGAAGGIHIFNKWKFGDKGYQAIKAERAQAERE